MRDLDVDPMARHRAERAADRDRKPQHEFVRLAGNAYSVMWPRNGPDMLSSSTFRRLCGARDMLCETADRPVSIREVGARGLDVAVSFHSPVRGCLRRDAAPVPHPDQTGSRQATARAERLLRDRCVPGGGLLEPGELQRSLRAPRRRSTVGLPASRPIERAAAGGLAPERDAGLPVVDGGRLRRGVGAKAAFAISEKRAAAPFGRL